MINPYYFIDENLNIGFKINLESHRNTLSFYIINIAPSYSGFGFETTSNNKIPKDIATFYTRLINQYKCKYHILFSASFNKNN